MASHLKSLRTLLAQNREKKGRLQEQLEAEQELVRRCESDIEKNKHFTYTVDEQVIETEPTEPGFCTVNCIICNMTCHENWPDDEDRRKCPAMDINGYCKICPQNCYWATHKNQPYVYVIRTHHVTKTAGDIKRKYEDAMHMKAKTEVEIASISYKLEKVDNEICAAERKLVG